MALVPLNEKFSGMIMVKATNTHPLSVATIRSIPTILLKLHFVPYHWLNASRIAVLKSIVSPTPADLTESDPSLLRKPVQANAIAVGISNNRTRTAATHTVMLPDEN